SVGLRATTPARMDLDPPLVAGVGTTVHALPFQCAASGLVEAKLILFVEPTAQASFALVAETASSFSSKCSTPGGVGTWRHRVPSHRSVNMSLPWSSPGL